MLGQTVATICCTDAQNRPHCFNCCYAFDRHNHLLIFKSAATALHSQIIMERPGVAGTILPDKLHLFSMKGIQFSGTVLFPAATGGKDAPALYYKKFPLARAVPGAIYMISLTSIKMTDNSKGFGNKITWQRDDTADAATLP
ncbi:hypothetical protein DLD77_00870 [Chitinophaga alhagiae]|uniref:Pyridoxamine 5'-phosphate oxidase putative domain-containing protein n=2 Tax=Chitinophaga alhagiae TaxID=2203219 RepID=A0ABM6W912_9BACT|nr:hypothetical protein DLD77_00870 [Chitinophaga alhagiae]